MNTKNGPRYSIGLDIGTGSVGWAVVDDNYALNKVKGKNMWGSRLFSTASTAKETRLKRGVRRRYNKRRERITLLRGLMNDMVMEVDDSFFIRMEHTTFLDAEDKEKELNALGKDFRNNFNLFVDPSFTDKEYFNRYPTIYHLRRELCNSTEKMDPRLVYLGLHHIMKYRGNFLREGQKLSLGDNNDITDVLAELLPAFVNVNSMQEYEFDSILQNLQDYLKLNTVRSRKVDLALELFNGDKDEKKLYKELFTGIVGNKFKLSKLFTDDSLKDNSTGIQFTDENFETTLEEAGLPDDLLDIVLQMQKVFQWIELMGIIGESTQGTISDVMIQRYENHKEDLAELKALIKHYLPKEYNSMFRKEGVKGSYKDYIEHPSRTTQEEFYKNISNKIKEINDPVVEKILQKIELETYMVKQNGRTYAAIPYQFQEEELDKIIQNQGQYYPDLLRTYNGNNMIKSILTFRIPYYYGPLNPESAHGWIIKQSGKENVRITPWNHEEVVDIDATATEFIQRMTNFCTYIPDEKVMPKKSLTCQKYEVLAELNKIRVNGKSLDTETKNRIIKDLFYKKKSVTDKTLKDWLYNNHIYLNNENLEITGYQKELAFSTNLSSWIDMNKIIGITDDNYELIENIIYDLTIFEDKKMLKRKLKHYSELTSEQITKLSKLNYTGWSRLSRKLITGIKCHNKYSKFGQKASILDVMEESNLALMEIINDEKLGYKAELDEINKHIDVDEFSYDALVKNLAGSPALKRGIWQTLLIVKEIVKVKGYAPRNIYIEFARNEGEKKRTTSAITSLMNQYKTIFNSTEDSDLYYTRNKEMKYTYDLLKSEDSKSSISDRLQLYYMQMGKCMYTGETLEIDKLSLYEIDHIVPQSMVMDDSLDNRVLVKSKENQRKINDPVSQDVRIKMQAYWKFLFDHHLISPKKYANLMKTEYTDKDINRFINRQLVETRQITKNVANILGAVYPTTKVVTVRADLSHEFREKYHIYKSRMINDYHHAHDAYIAAILGTYIKRRFPKLEAQYIYGEYMKWSKETKKKDQTKNRDGFILNSMNNLYVDEDCGELIWDPTYITNIKKCFNYKDCFVTKMLEEKSGPLFKETVFANKEHDSKSKASIPVNKFRADVSKYGGYSNENYCMVAIRGNKKKGKKVQHIGIVAALPLRFRTLPENEVISYFEKEEGLENIVILNNDIRTYQLLEIDGGLLTLASPSEFNTAWQLVLDENSNTLVHYIEEALDKKYYKNEHLKKTDIEALYMLLVDKIKKYYPYYKNIAVNLEGKYETFVTCDIETQCQVIYQILRMLHANAENGNMKLEKFNMGNERMGRMTNKTVDLDKAYFISQSVTGIYSKKYKL